MEILSWRSFKWFAIALISAVVAYWLLNFFLGSSQEGNRVRDWLTETLSISYSTAITA